MELAPRAGENIPDRFRSAPFTFSQPALDNRGIGDPDQLFN